MVFFYWERVFLEFKSSLALQSEQKDKFEFDQFITTFFTSSVEVNDLIPLPAFSGKMSVLARTYELYQ